MLNWDIEPYVTYSHQNWDIFSNPQPIWTWAVLNLDGGFLNIQKLSHCNRWGLGTQITLPNPVQLFWSIWRLKTISIVTRIWSLIKIGGQKNSAWNYHTLERMNFGTFKKPPQVQRTNKYSLRSVSEACRSDLALGLVMQVGVGAWTVPERVWPRGADSPMPA